MKILKTLTFGFLTWALLACNAGKNETNLELFQGMMDQINVKSQDWDPDSKDLRTVRNPPEGTLARGHKPYLYAGDPLGAEKNLSNPLSGDNSPEVVLRGKDRFEIYCSVCHGHQGDGNGTVAPKMALHPPSLLTDKVRNFRDGRIFHIITEGQGVMGSYANQVIDEKDRWAIVNYVRSLQNKAKAN